MARASVIPCRVEELEHAPEMAVLLPEYAEECRIAGLGEILPNWQTYRTLEQIGVLHAIKAITAEGVLIGFITLLVSELPHYSVVTATTESFFVSAAYRRTGAGIALLRAAERVAVDLGAAGPLVSAPVGGRLAALLPRLGYRQTNAVFFKGASLPVESAPAREIAPMSEQAINQVAELEAAMMGMPQIEIETTHAFHAGMYARTIRIPAGTLLTGALIRIPTLLIVSGRATVYTGTGQALQIDGYRVLQAGAGRKQVFHAIGDTDVTMVFPSMAATVEDAEAEFTAETDKLMTRRGLSRGSLISTEA